MCNILYIGSFFWDSEFVFGIYLNVCLYRNKIRNWMEWVIVLDKLVV